MTGPDYVPTRFGLPAGGEDIRGAVRASITHLLEVFFAQRHLGRAEPDPGGFKINENHLRSEIQAVQSQMSSRSESTSFQNHRDLLRVV